MDNKPKPASEILEKLWAQTTFDRFVNDLCVCDQVSSGELAKKANLPIKIIADVDEGLTPSLGVAVAIARALGYSEGPFLEKAIEEQLKDAGLSYTCKLTHKAPWEG